MPRENTEIMRSVIAAINRGDAAAARAFATEDCVTDFSNSRGPLQGVHRGRDELQKLIEGFLEPWAEFRWELVEVIEVDAERVLSVGRFQLRGHGSGVEVSAGGAAIWTIREGEVAVWELFQSKAEALEAAGLDP